MNRNEFVQALKAGKVSGAYLFEGVEENIKSVTLAALRKAVLADGLAELNESVMENPSAGEIIAACETLPFASDKRLVVVRELNGTTGRSEAEELGLVEGAGHEAHGVLAGKQGAQRVLAVDVVDLRGGVGLKISVQTGLDGSDRNGPLRVLNNEHAGLVRRAEREEVRAGRGEPFVLHGRQ